MNRQNNSFPNIYDMLQAKVDRSPDPQLQNLNQTLLCSKSEQRFSFMSKSAPTVVNMFLSINISNSNNLNKF